MLIIAGVAAAAAAVIAWWNRASVSPAGGEAVVSIRRQAGVIGAIVNMVNAVLDALMLVRRIAATAPGNGGTQVPVFGRRSGDVTDHEEES